MLCTFCGTENGPENIFCGMCGVRLERRKAERRNRHDGLKCPACGHANDVGHKFCGMCGSRMDRRMVERRAASPEEPRATAMANAQLPTPEAPRRAKEVAPTVVASDHPKETQPSAVSEVPPHPKPQPAIFRNEPPRVTTIGGPSFLGLGDEPENSGDYLLEDESSSGGMLRRLVLVAILAAIAGLVFVGWRSSSRANSKPPAPSPTQPTAAASSPQTKDTNSAAETTPPAKDSDSSPTNDKAGGGDAKDASAADSKATPAAATVAGAADKTAEPASEASASAKRKASPEPPVDVIPGQRKPSAMLLRAQQYLQGRGGVTQNCEQGLMYLRAAAQKNEPAAAVQMGALYASGHCVQRDEVAAYRWFNSAHELDPANPWIQTNLDQLWAEMTPQQRRQVTQ